MSKAKNTKEAAEELKKGKGVDLLTLGVFNEDGEKDAEQSDENDGSQEKDGVNGIPAFEDVPELAEFAKEYPDIFDIPKQVEEKMKKGKGLLQAYREYENEQLREKLRALEQGEKNKKSSVGSVSGDAAGDDELDELLRIFGSVFD